MLPVVNALQMVVVVQVVQTIALAVAVVFVLRKLQSVLAQNRERQQQRDDALVAELKRFELQMRGARAESAQYLESIFSGVQGMLRNLDMTRAEVTDLRKKDAPATDRFKLRDASNR